MIMMITTFISPEMGGAIGHILTLCMRLCILLAQLCLCLCYLIIFVFVLTSLLVFVISFMFLLVKSISTWFYLCWFTITAQKILLIIVIKTINIPLSSSKWRVQHPCCHWNNNHKIKIMIIFKVLNSRLDIQPSDTLHWGVGGEVVLMMMLLW